MFAEIVTAVKDQYPNLTETPFKGQIATSWHRVYIGGDSTDQAAQASSRAPASANSNQTNAFTTDSAFKRFFIRFDVTVTGGRPWQVKLVGRAAEWDQGNAVPTELRGASRPPWLDGRNNALLVAIHRRLKAYAVARRPDQAEASTADIGPRTDPKVFADIPTAAAQQLAGLRDEVLRRDWARIRRRIVADVEWSLGAEPGLDAAMALWQADPTALDEMQKALDLGCATRGADIVCPKAATEPTFAGHRLVLALRDGEWKVISFVSGL